MYKLPAATDGPLPLDDFISILQLALQLLRSTKLNFSLEFREEVIIAEEKEEEFEQKDDEKKKKKKTNCGASSLFFLNCQPSQE